MSDVVLKVENLSKEYRLGMTGRGTLRQDMQSWWARLRGREDPNSLLTVPQNFQGGEIHSDNKRFWALRDISFEVERGKILGIIGRNGAGKSTLLKIISRISSPTKGYVKSRGRLASLLEVGTGFHPELTGRENVFLNGAILGMAKAEIRSRFDEILDFSGIEKFIDTPVKRYSSGMYVRLAFAVAAHLDPEILIVDEVLAVGDAEFQAKCLGKMGEVARGGRTVLFVSHNMSAVKRLCHRSLLIDQGLLICDQDTFKTFERYKELQREYSPKKDIMHKTQLDFSYHASDFQINSMRIIGRAGHQENIFSISESIFIELIYEVRKKILALMVRVYIHKDGELFLATFDTDQDDKLAASHDKGKYTARIDIPGLPSARGGVQLIMRRWHI